MRLVWVLIAMAGCYHDPDYGGTHFKCGPELGCPSGQACVSGVCSNEVDASNPNGLACGPMTCEGGLFCCRMGGVYSCVTNDIPCDYSLRCDAQGAPECTGGSTCCWTDVLNYSDYLFAPCAQPVCSGDAECTNGSYPHCCASTNYSWKTCQAACT